MMMGSTCQFQQGAYASLPALILQNGLVQLTIVPELGGKISSIRDLVTGREWLWRNPHLPIRPVQYDASFVEAYDTGGLDECFPAVSGGPYPTAPWSGTQIPDHGELWCQTWRYEWMENSPERLRLKMSCHGVRFPYRFERTLTMVADSAQVQLDYEVVNLTGFALPFIWSIHPLMNIEPGMRLRLPAGVSQLFTEGAPPPFLGRDASPIAWPVSRTNTGEEIDLSLVPPVGIGRAAKLYTAMLAGSTPVETSLVDPSGQHAFTMRFRPDEITHIGLWLNYSAWSGSGSDPYFNLGLEPCIGDSDDLGTVTRAGRAAILGANASRAWSLTLSLS